MTDIQLATVSGIVLSLLFRFLPGLSTWFDGLSSPVKQSLMACLLVVVAAASYALACSGWLLIAGLVCDKAGFWSLINSLIAALMANQSVYLITRQKTRA